MPTRTCKRIVRRLTAAKWTEVLRKSTAAWILVVFRRPRAIRTTANKVWQTTNRCCCRKDRPPPQQQTKLKKKETSRVRCRRSPGGTHADRKLQVLLRESTVAGILVNFWIGADWFAVKARQVTTNRRLLLDRPSSQQQTKQKNT
jgi:hypothetical protein